MIFLGGELDVKAPKSIMEKRQKALTPLLSTPFRDVKMTFGGGNNLNCEQYNNPGIDSVPLREDNGIAINIDKKGRMAIIGNLDTRNPPRAKCGETCIYSREAHGFRIASVWLKTDGSIVMQNEKGSMVMKPGGAISFKNESGNITLNLNGDINLNGVMITKDGNVSIEKDLIVQNKKINNHLHSQPPDSAGDVQSNTGPNI